MLNAGTEDSGRVVERHKLHGARWMSHQRQQVKLYKSMGVKAGGEVAELRCRLLRRRERVQVASPYRLVLINPLGPSP
jgi:hypothetical protein